MLGTHVLVKLVIVERTERCGEVEFGLDGVAEGWVCDVVGVVSKI